MFLVSLGMSSVYAQTNQKYDITVAGFSIGEMTANRFQKADTTYYVLTSDVSFWFFGTIKLSYKTTSKYVGKQFISSQVITNTNKDDFESNVYKQGNQYIVKAETYKYALDTVIKKQIVYSAARLYFDEPKLFKEMLAENYGLLSPITPHDGYYEVDVNGNQNKFYYEDGVMVRAVMESPIKNFVIKKK